MITIYVLLSEKQKIYIGQTNNLGRRLAEHNHNHTISTRSKGIWKVIYLEQCVDRSAAVKREKALKSSRGRAWIRSEILKNRTTSVS